MRSVQLLRDSVELMRNVKLKMKTLSVWIMGVLGSLDHVQSEKTARVTLLGTTVWRDGAAAAMEMQIVRQEISARRQNVS